MLFFLATISISHPQQWLCLTSINTAVNLTLLLTACKAPHSQGQLLLDSLNPTQKILEAESWSKEVKACVSSPYEHTKEHTDLLLWSVQTAPSIRSWLKGNLHLAFSNISFTIFSVIDANLLVVATFLWFRHSHEVLAVDCCFIMRTICYTSRLIRIWFILQVCWHTRNLVPAFGDINNTIRCRKSHIHGGDFL